VQAGWGDVGSINTVLVYQNRHAQVWVSIGSLGGMVFGLGDVAVQLVVLEADGSVPAFPPAPGKPIHRYDLADLVKIKEGVGLEELAMKLPPGHFDSPAMALEFQAEKLRRHGVPILTGRLSPEDEAALERIVAARWK
jgi:hypothetical protein